jgi:beta-alanine degradation protein BauB
MPRILFLALFLLAMAAPALAQDPVKVDAKHYTVESQNARVRILRVKYGPHEKSVMHRHPAAVAVAITDAKMKFTFADGKTEERDMKAGQAMWTPATKHSPENMTDHDVEVVLIEFKSRKAPPKKPADSTTTTTTPPKQ